MLQVDNLTYEDFFNTNIYKEVFETKNSLDRKKLEADLTNRARELKVVGFRKMLAEELKQFNHHDDSDMTKFSGQEKELLSGNYICDDTGVWYDGEQIITHPIMPVELMENIETSASKVKIAYNKNHNWQHKVFDKTVLSSSRDIISLSGFGVSVNSLNAGMLTKYLSEIEDLNIERLHHVKSIGRFGWIKGQFSPYLSNISFDGEIDYKGTFEAVRTQGDQRLWIDTIKPKLMSSEVFRLMFIASISSPLLHLLNVNPFVVHLWGTSGGGKTLSMQAAASAWGDPLILAKSFNTTGVGMEILAGFFHSIPLFLDESQVANNQTLEKDLYMLTQGQGRVRGSKNVTIRQMQTWKNITVSTGERPLTDDNSGAGAVNRIISIESNDMIFDQGTGKEFAAVIHNNFGFVGEKWINFIIKEKDAINNYYNEYMKTLAVINTTDKQRLSLAVLSTGLEFLNRMTGWNVPGFSGSFVKSSMQVAANVDVGVRAYDYLIETISMNEDKFAENPKNERWGKFDTVMNTCIMIKRVFNEILDKGGFSGKQLISWMASHEKLHGDCNKTYRFGGTTSKAIEFRIDMPDTSDEPKF